MSPPGADALKHYGKTVLDALVRPGLVLTPVLTAGGTEFRADRHASALRPLVEALDAGLTAVSREAVEFDGTLLAKSTAMTAHDRDFVRIAGVVEQLARSAGLLDVADRIRPSTGEAGALIEPPDVGDAPLAPQSPATPRPRIEPGMPGSSPFIDEPSPFIDEP